MAYQGDARDGPKDCLREAVMAWFVCFGAPLARCVWGCDRSPHWGVAASPAEYGRSHLPLLEKMVFERTGRCCQCLHRKVDPSHTIHSKFLKRYRMKVKALMWCAKPMLEWQDITASVWKAACHDLVVERRKCQWCVGLSLLSYHWTWWNLENQCNKLTNANERTWVISLFRPTV